VGAADTLRNLVNPDRLGRSTWAGLVHGLLRLLTIPARQHDPRSARELNPRLPPAFPSGDTAADTLFGHGVHCANFANLDKALGMSLQGCVLASTGKASDPIQMTTSGTTAFCSSKY